MRSIMMILGLLFIALSHPSFAQKPEEAVVRVPEGSPLTVECPLRVEQRALWRRDGGALPLELRPAGEAPAAAGAVTARLHAAAARAHHAGVYTCARGPDAHRVRVLVVPAAPSAPAPAPAPAPGTETAAATVPPAAAPAPAPAPADEAPSEWREFVYELHRAIELSCKPGGGADAPAGIYTWKANGTAVGPAGALAGRHELREGDAVLAVPRSTEDDWGNYTCLVDGAPVRGYRVRARPVLRLPADSNVVEGQKLKLTCRVLGRPYPAVSWTYSPDVSVNATDVEEALGDRVKLQTSAAGVERGDLVIEAAQRGDAGLYSCRVPDAPAPSAPAPGAEPAAPPAAATVLRVKDMYAALWPFLGICAEVFILCAIILVYEKRRTKPELDDSDTDNHDQKES